jgi:hypothetical protein
VKSLLHPVLGIVAIAVALGLALRTLFFRLAPWLWSKESPLDVRAITPWTRWAVAERDGIEPYALLLLVLGACAATVVLSRLSERLPERLRAAVAASALPAVIVLAFSVPLRPPLSVVANTPGLALLVVSVSLLVTVFVGWAAAARRYCVSALLVLGLAAVCFLPTTLLSRFDGQTVFAPALRLVHGASLRNIYFQYDLLLSLLAVAWFKVGADPMAFSFVTGLGYFLLFIGLWLTMRRWFSCARLLAPLLVCLVLVRFYGNMHDASALPQLTPWRLDLWIVPLALTLVFGLDHWLVGLALALLCFFCRSFGILYLAAYVLAWGTDFLAARSIESERAEPFFKALWTGLRRALPIVGLVGCSFVVGRLMFGSLTTEAVSLYRSLGIGMTKIASGSFYWWIVPLSAVVAGLVFYRRASFSLKQRQGAISLSALAIANSLYFFGRSHESNLVLLSAIFLVLFFLAIDLAWGLPETRDALAMRWFLRILPWCTVAFCAYFYAGQVVARVESQAALVGRHQALAPAHQYDFVPVIDCREISGAIGDAKVVYFSFNDFWFYWQCSNEPAGGYQPLTLSPLMEPLIRQLNRDVTAGHMIVVPKQARDWASVFKQEFLPKLGSLSLTETEKYLVYHRP